MFQCYWSKHVTEVLRSWPSPILKGSAPSLYLSWGKDINILKSPDPYFLRVNYLTLNREQKKDSPQVLSAKFYRPRGKCSIVEEDGI